MFAASGLEWEAPSRDFVKNLNARTVLDFLVTAHSFWPLATFSISSLATSGITVLAITIATFKPIHIHFMVHHEFIVVHVVIHAVPGSPILAPHLGGIQVFVAFTW